MRIALWGRPIYLPTISRQQCFAPESRRGVALMMALAVIAMLTVILAVVTKQIVLQRLVVIDQADAGLIGHFRAAACQGENRQCQ